MSAPVFDRDEMLDRLDGDQEFLADVLEVFLDETPKMLEQMRFAVGDRDTEKIERAAHAMKGALLNIAARPAAALARQLEDCGREGGLGLIDETLLLLEAELGRLENELRRN